MPELFICQHCHQQKPANPRLKGKQRYCGTPKCQRARKAAWHKEAMAHDDIYRAQQIDCLQQWRKNRPLHQYQRQYRAAQSDYVRRNREQQHRRNQQRSRKEPLIVKMDALKSHQPIIKTDIYQMTPCQIDASGKIVKMDAFLVQLQLLQGDIMQHLANAP
jgi:hypothetical protein